MKRFAVLGDPVAHSKSPAMHAAAYRALGLDCTYEAIRATAEDLPMLVKALRDADYEGFNVTVPHKQRILALVDRVDASASEVGAANTLVRRAGGEIVAHNTDVPALVAELRALSPARTAEEWRASRAVVLGAGGAGKAAVAALHGIGVTDIVVRTRADLGVRLSDPRALTLIQTTPAGMLGADPGDPIAASIDWPSLPPAAIALDVIYSPPETPFLRAARARGLRAANGLGMLARQGALAFELWLGVPAPLDVMRAALK